MHVRLHERHRTSAIQSYVRKLLLPASPCLAKHMAIEKGLCVNKKLTFDNVRGISSHLGTDHYLQGIRGLKRL